MKYTRISLNREGEIPLFIVFCEIKMLNIYTRNKNSGFTLIEMLIVIAVIGILASTLFPKIVWMLARARDTQRVADLRNLATAIEVYQMDTGKYPRLSKKINGHEVYIWSNPWFAWSVSNLKTDIEDYISMIPKDPDKNNYVDIITRSSNHNISMRIRRYFEEWEYLYQLGVGKGLPACKIKKPNFWLLIAKVETSSVANYVLLNHRNWFWESGGTRYFANHCGWVFPSQFVKWAPFLCSSVEKVETWKEVAASEQNSKCKYSSKEQLYYIVKIE